MAQGVRRRVLFPVGAALIAALCCVTLTACSPRSTSTVTDAQTGKPLDLGRVEVRQYRGQKLGSAADFRVIGIKGSQTVDVESYRLRVSGQVRKPLSLTYDEVLRRPKYSKVVTIYCVEGWSVKVLWEGVRIADILRQAGYRRGAATVIFHCADGYTTSLPLSVVVHKNLLLANRMNGMDLPRERGFPFQVVAEDRWGYKWARWVTEIEVSNDANYQGYWEKRGYDNGGELPAGNR